MTSIILGSNNFWIDISIISTLILTVIFSIAQASFGNLTKTKVDEEYKKNKDDIKIERLKRLIDKKDILIPSVQMWNIFFILILGFFVMIWYLHNLEQFNYILAVLLLTATFMLLSFIKILSFKIASLNAYNISLRLARTFEVISAVTFPLINLVFTLLNPLFKIFGADIKKDVYHYSEEDLKHILKESHRHGVIEKDEQELLHSIFEFGDTIVAEVMTPRLDMICIKESDTLVDFIHLVKKSGLSKIPVYGESIDHILGVVYVKDILSALEENKLDMHIKQASKPTYFVPGTKKINELLKEMQKKKVSMAIVVDEFGGTEGLITVEDIIEEIVGEITDEYDKSSPDFMKCDDSSYIISAKVVIEDVNNKLKLNIPCEKFETIGGYAYGLFDRIPNQGDTKDQEDFTLTIERKVGRRIDKVKIKKINP
ncbi:MAG: hemolysin family protein [Armatimonadota bacterium]